VNAPTMTATVRRRWRRALQTRLPWSKSLRLHVPGRSRSGVAPTIAVVAGDLLANRSAGSWPNRLMSMSGDDNQRWPWFEDVIGYDQRPSAANADSDCLGRAARTSSRPTIAALVKALQTTPSGCFRPSAPRASAEYASAASVRSAAREAAPRFPPAYCVAGRRGRSGGGSKKGVRLVPVRERPAYDTHRSRTAAARWLHRIVPRTRRRVGAVVSARSVRCAVQAGREGRSKQPASQLPSVAKCAITPRRPGPRCSIPYS